MSGLGIYPPIGTDERPAKVEVVNGGGGGGTGTVDIADAPSIENRLDAIETALTNGTAVVQVSGNDGEKDLRGLHASRPSADSVAVGTTFWSVDEPNAPGTVFVSDGTDWAVLIDLSE